MTHPVSIIYRCPKCGHNSRGHVFDSNGKTRCPECPEEVCGVTKEENDLPTAMLDFGELTTVGIMPINEMSRRELIEEIMHAQFVALNSGKFTDETMRSFVAQIRVSSAKARIYREAGVRPPNPFGEMFGWDS